MSGIDLIMSTEQVTHLGIPKERVENLPEEYYRAQNEVSHAHPEDMT